MAKKEQGKISSFEELLGKLELNDFQQFVREYAQKNDFFKTEMELYFANKENLASLEEKYKALIEESIKPKMNRYDEVTNIPVITAEYKKYIKEMSDFVVNNNFRDAFYG